jgi:hypothetical protein
MKFRILPGGVLGGITIMHKALRPSALVPPGLVVESAVCVSGTTLITVHPHEQGKRLSGMWGKLRPYPQSVSAGCN